MATTLLIALITFLAGLYLGRRSTRRHHREELASQARKLQRVIDFADAYIDQTAPQRGLIVVRSQDGHIVDLPIRCGTNAIQAKALLAERQRLKSLH